MSIILKPSQVNRMVTENFSYEECQCACCQRIKVIPLFFLHMGLLQKIRDNIGAIIINSGYRCPTHNATLPDSSNNSMHMTFATDVRPADNDPSKLFRIWHLAQNFGFKGIGIYDTFIHLDMRANEALWDNRKG